MKTALRTALARLKRGIGLEGISPDTLPEDAANRLRKLQMRGAIEQMRVFVIGNTLFAPVMAFQAWDAGLKSVVLVWSTLMLAFSWWLFWTWRTSYQTDGQAADMDKFVHETKINSAIWCVGFALFFPFVDGASKTVLTSIMVGSLALGTVGFSQAPRAAFWYLAIQAGTLILVPSLYAFVFGTSHDLLLGVLAVVVAAAVFNAVLERAKTQMHAFKDHEALAHKTEVVDLLLKDYEEQGNEWIWRTDAQGKLISCPRPILDLLALDESALSHVNLFGAVKDAVAAEGEGEIRKIRKAFEQKVDLNDVTLPLRHPQQGANKWIVMKGRPQIECDAFAGYRGIFADATATVEAQKHVEFLATHDPLTRTNNRNFVHAKLEALDAAAHKALIFLIDLDGFKQVNDGYGHSVGDALLKQVADRLYQTVGDKAIVARLGGDEFLVMCERRADQILSVHDELGYRILESLSNPFVIDQLEIGLSGSVGIARFPKDTENGLTLLNQADLALYAAKRGGRNRCVTFVDKMMDGLQKRIIVTERLRKALQDGAITPYYQAQYSAQNSTLVGAEALARWTDSELGFVGPDVFIPIAEETGLIHDLGEQLLRRACLDALDWPPAEDGTPLMLAVNLSPVQVMRGNVAKLVKRVLAETGFPPDRLEIEITEGVLIDDVPATRFLLEELSDAGIEIALDDFGTGYSSLSYVRALPLNRLKIDRSFIFEIEEPEAQSIVSAIVSLCDRLKLEVVAEGVETQKAVHILAELGCDVLQGYFFSRPLTASDFQALALGETRSQTG
jgi:diguanylate cyclase (GGDEF)-like protein